MRPGRNDSCPCGSGRRYKHCCGLLPAAGGAPAPGVHGASEDSQGLIDAANRLRSQGRPREALPLYRRALEIDPRSAEAHNNLGNTFFELGQPQDAADCYLRALTVKASAEVFCNLANALWQLGRHAEALSATERALALDSRLSMAHNILGLLRAASGQRTQAVASYRQALALNPGYLEALNNLGNTLRDVGEHSEAVSLYRKAIELDAQSGETYCNLGNVLSELSRFEEATANFRHALALQADSVRARLGLGAALRMQSLAAEAEASCLAALSLEPQNVEALSLLGELRVDRGLFSDAQQLFQRALALDPQFASVYCSIAAYRKMTADDGAWLKGVETLLESPLPLGHEISLRYALGKYFDDLGRYDEAFANYRLANDATRRCGPSHDPGRLTGRVDRIIGAFDGAFLGRRHSGASASELPVFIIGMPRSGTSLTEQILASHPSVFGAGEVRFWNHAFNTFEAAEVKDESGARLFPGIAHDYLARLTSSAGGALRVIDKMPANFLYAGLIHAAFPRARIIHMQRHPLDTCLSIYFQDFVNRARYGHDLDDLAHYYREYVRITDHWRSLLPASALLEVPYEALVEDQEGWSRRMLEFIGLPWDPKCLDFHNTDRVVITASRWQVRQRISSASVGRWRNYEKHLGPLRHLTELPRTAAAAPGAVRV
jgi:tetratricopeptide (TPR) repeat protein